MLQLLLNAVLAAPSDTEISALYTFEQYKLDFDKKYASTEEHELRSSVFAANLAKIVSHNADGSQTYRMNVNKFADLTPTEFKGYYKGYAKGRARHAQSLLDVPAGPLPGLENVQRVEDLPDAWDWRTQTTKGGSKIVTPAKDQGGCGSCWAFSTAETLESHVAIETDKLFMMSPQQVVDCAPNPDKCGGTGGCEGSVQWLGFNYTIGTGITTEKDYPYKGQDQKCKTASIKPVAGIKGYVRLPTNNYTMLMNAVATIGPIAISAAAEPWQLYSSGVFSQNCGADVDHAIQTVGYGVVTKSNTTYWIVRNSWGASWGENGYIRIKRTGLKQPCKTDNTPGDGTGCAGGPKSVTVCGECGMLSDSSYPTGGHLM
jgi:cathepsin L